MLELKGVEKMDKKELTGKFQRYIQAQISDLYKRADNLSAVLDEKLLHNSYVDDSLEQEFCSFIRKIDFVSDVAQLLLNRTLVSFSDRQDITVEGLIENAKSLLKMLESMFVDINCDFDRIEAEIDLVGRQVVRGGRG